MGPESSRNVGGSAEPERPAGRDQAGAPATLLRPAGPALFLLPGGERRRQLDGLWKFTLPRLSHCRESMAPPRRWDLRGFIQAEAFQSGTRAHSLRVGKEGT